MFPRWNAPASPDRGRGRPAQPAVVLSRVAHGQWLDPAAGELGRGAAADRPGPWVGVAPGRDALDGRIPSAGSGSAHPIHPPTMQTPTPQPPSHPLDEDQMSDLAPMLRRPRLDRWPSDLKATGTHPPTITSPISPPPPTNTSTSTADTTSPTPHHHPTANSDPYGSPRNRNTLSIYYGHPYQAVRTKMAVPHLLGSGRGGSAEENRQVQAGSAICLRIPCDAHWPVAPRRYADSVRLRSAASILSTVSRSVQTPKPGPERANRLDGLISVTRR